MLAVVTPHAVRVLTIDRRPEVGVVARNTVVSIGRVRPVFDWELVLRMVATGGGSPGDRRVAVLASGWKVRMAGKRAPIVVVLVATDAKRGRAFIDGRLPHVA